MISCKSCEHMLISKTEHTIWRKCSVTQNTKKISHYLKCPDQKTQTFLLFVDSFKTKIRLIKNLFWLFDSEISSFNQ